MSSSDSHRIKAPGGVIVSRAALRFVCKEGQLSAHFHVNAPMPQTRTIVELRVDGGDPMRFRFTGERPSMRAPYTLGANQSLDLARTLLGASRMTLEYDPTFSSPVVSNFDLTSGRDSLAEVIGCHRSLGGSMEDLLAEPEQKEPEIDDRTAGLRAAIRELLILDGTDPDDPKVQDALGW